MDWQIVGVSVVSVLFGGGLLQAITQARKVKPETNQIILATSEKAVLLQASVLENLDEQRKRDREWYEEQLQRARSELKEALERIDQLEEEVRQLKGEA